MKAKHLFLSLLLAGGVISLASCSSDEPTPEGQPGEVTFTVQLPADMATRSFGDGTTAIKLHYAIYEQDAVAGTDGCALIENSTVTFTGLKATVTERLLPGKTYKAAFWAASADAPYTFNADAMTMTVNTADLKTNDENGDGFFGKLENISTKNGSVSKSVSLRRPFAQVNVGTDDWEQAQKLGLVLTDVQTSLSIPDVPTGLNLFDGTTVTGSEQTADFDIAAIPDGETFPVAGEPAYKYMAMAYVLMPKAADKSITTVTFNSNNTAITPAAVVWNNVPVQRNYRTNIYGSLLTKPAQFNVTIVPTWSRPDYEVSVWDGTVEAPVVDETTGNVTVNTAAQFAGLQNLMAESTNGLAGKTVTLNTDIDLNGIAWTSIGQGLTGGKQRFQGTFDGKGHTIANMQVKRRGTNVKYGGGLFEDMTGGAVIKNVTLENPLVTSAAGYNVRAGNVRGIISGYAYGNVTFENITIIGGKITGYGKIGGILGMAADPGNGVTTFKNCVVKGLEIQGCYNCGGLCGLAMNQVNAEGCTVEDVTFSQEPGQTFETLTDVVCKRQCKADGSAFIQAKANGIYWKYGTVYYAAFGKFFTYDIKQDYSGQGQGWTWVGEDKLIAEFICDDFADYKWEITTPWTEPATPPTE